jgi:hypothetical protein
MSGLFQGFLSALVKANQHVAKTSKGSVLTKAALLVTWSDVTAYIPVIMAGDQGQFWVFLPSWEALLSLLPFATPLYQPLLQLNHDEHDHTQPHGDQ